ncbi:MAG: hypothetical protein FWD58_04955 [Firmicutes bacterium]|nr:hypothetical protein [Bacillota bacterium]
MKKVIKNIAIVLVVAFTLCIGVVYAAPPSGAEGDLEFHGEIFVNYPRTWWITPVQSTTTPATTNGTGPGESGNPQYFGLTAGAQQVLAPPTNISKWDDNHFYAIFSGYSGGGVWSGQQVLNFSMSFKNTSGITWHAGTAAWINYNYEALPAISVAPALLPDDGTSATVSIACAGAKFGGNTLYYNFSVTYHLNTDAPNPGTHDECLWVTLYFHVAFVYGSTYNTFPTPFPGM